MSARVRAYFWLAVIALGYATYLSPSPWPSPAFHTYFVFMMSDRNSRTLQAVLTLAT